VGVESFITRHLPGRPQGDPAALRAAASTWTATASGLRDAIGNAGAHIGSLDDSWQGSAKAAFVTEWTKLARAVDDGCGEMSGVASALDQLAAKLEAAQRKYDETLATAVVTTGASIAAGFITFGATDAAGAVEIVTATTDIVIVAEEVTAEATTLLSQLATIAEQMVLRFVVGFGVNVASQAAVGAVMDHDPGDINYREALGAGVAEGLAAVPDVEFDSALAKFGFTGLRGVFQDAVGQAAAGGQMDPIELLFSGAQSATGLGTVDAGPGFSDQLGKAIRESAFDDALSAQLKASEGLLGHGEGTGQPGLDAGGSAAVPPAEQFALPADPLIVRPEHIATDPPGE